MTKLKISIEENPAPADLDVIEHALVQHNEAHSEPRHETMLVIFREPSGSGLDC